MNENSPRPGDIIRVFGDTGAFYLRGPVRRTILVKVYSICRWPQEPHLIQVGGHLCRQDLTVRSGAPHTRVDISGAPRSEGYPEGMWEVLRPAAEA